MGVIVLLSNYLVQFPINKFGLENILTYGAFSYPVAFLITDLANRSYGKNGAKNVVYFGFNIGILFINERNFLNIKNSHLELDKKILKKLNYNNLFTKFFAWIGSTISGPLISFFKTNGKSIAIGIISFIFLFKIS